MGIRYEDDYKADLSVILDVDLDGKPTDWFTRQMSYVNAQGLPEDVFHIHPNKGCHSADMTTIDGVDTCLCDCEPTYDWDPEYIGMLVIHNVR